MVFNYLEINSFFSEKYSFFGKNLVWSYTDWPASQGGELLTTVPIDEALKIGYHGGYSRLILRGWTRVELTHFLGYTWKQRLIQIKMHSKILLYSSTTLRFLFYVLVLLYAGYVLFDFFSWWNQSYELDDLNKNPAYWFYYYHNILPIIPTGWKTSSIYKYTYWLK